MGKRHKINIRKSKKMFTKHAKRIHPKNAGVLTGLFGPMRGGIRL